MLDQNLASQKSEEQISSVQLDRSRVPWRPGLRLLAIPYISLVVDGSEEENG